MSVAIPAVEQQRASTSYESRPLKPGRIREPGLEDSSRTFAVLMHIAPLALWLGVFPFALVVPPILWAIRKEEGKFDDDHGRETTNFAISFVLWHFILLATILGVLLWPVLWIVAIVNGIRGAIAARDGEYFRYPLTIRILS